MKFADLHIHTHWSDGFYSPKEVLDEAQKIGFSAIAITDHDTLQGSDEADLLIGNYNMELIPGVEITTLFDQEEFHVLGYFIDKKNQELLAALHYNRQQRHQRMVRMVEKLNDIGLKFEFSELEAYVGKGGMGRLNLAHFLVKKKIVNSTRDAFEKYIGQTSEGYEKGGYISTEEAIKLIRSAGGIAVWAHPGLADVEKKICKLVSLGINGLEVFYPKHSETQVFILKKLSDEHGLLVTGGSDCHGKGKSRVLMGEVRLPYDYVKALKESTKAGLKAASAC